MKPSKDLTFRCVCCGGLTNVLHEVIPGSGNRQLCIKYSLQVPLCIVDHRKAHGTYSVTHEKRPIDYAKEFIEWLGLDYYSTLRAIKDKGNRQYLEDNAEKCKQKIMTKIF